MPGLIGRQLTELDTNSFIMKGDRRQPPLIGSLLGLPRRFLV
jgi:hypothetical protein